MVALAPVERQQDVHSPLAHKVNLVAGLITREHFLSRAHRELPHRGGERRDRFRREAADDADLREGQRRARFRIAPAGGLENLLLHPFEGGVAGFVNPDARAAADQPQLRHVVLDVLSRGDAGGHAAEEQITAALAQPLVHLLEEMRRGVVHGLHPAQVEQEKAPLVEVGFKFAEELVGGAEE